MKKTRYFQWIEGELSGVVSVLDNITCIDGEYFYNFTDGESCNMRYISKMTNSIPALKGKVMVEIASPQDPWVATTVGAKKYTDPTSNEIVDIPPVEDITSKTTTGTGQNLSIGESAVGQKRYTPPKFRGPFPDLPSLEDYAVIETPVIPRPTPTVIAPQPKPIDVTHNIPDEAPVEPIAPVQQANTAPAMQYVPPKPEPKTRSDNPIEILAKTCKKHSTDINLTVTMDLPSKAIFKMVSEEFEDGGTAFIDCLIANLDVNDVIDSIRTALVIAYSKCEEG